MKVVRHFDWTEDSDFGAGFAPKHIQFANPVFNGNGAAHDVLEHLFDKVGGLEGELQALGAMFIVRQHRVFDGMGLYAALGNELESLLRDHAVGERTLKEPPKQELIEDYSFSSDELRLHVRKGIALFIREWVNGQGNADHSLRAEARRDLPRDVVSRILGWVNHGVHAARKFSERHELNGWDWDHLREEIALQWDKKLIHRNDGGRIRVDVNFATKDVQVRHREFFERAYA